MLDMQTAEILHSESLGQENSEILNTLLIGDLIHFDHYAGNRLNFSCVSAKGIHQQLMKLDEPDCGKIIDVMDVSGGYGSACLGAGNELIKKALQTTLENDGYVTDEMGSLARSKMLHHLFGLGGLFTSHFTPGLYHVSGRNSGSEGMELALRLIYESLAKDNYKRNRILAFEGAWHGWTSGLLPLINRRHFTHKLPKINGVGETLLPISFLPFGESQQLEDFFKEYGATLGAVIVEPVQGDAGILLPPPGYLRQLANLCEKYDVLLVADEILTFAKTGKFFAMTDERGPIPTDITVIGKSLGMGIISTSMVIARKELTIRSCGAVATSDLRPITCAIIDEGMQIITKEKLLEKSLLNGTHLLDQCRKELVEQFPEIYFEARGVGYLNGIELTEDAAPYIRAMRTCMIEQGVYVEFMAGAGRRSHLRYVFPTMRIAPPLITTQSQLSEIVTRLVLGTQQFISKRKKK